MLFTILGLLCILLSATCFVFILVHAFRRSVGTGVIVLCIPFYNLYYGFMQFEHRYKSLIIPGWLGGFGIGAALLTLGAPAPPVQLPPF
jgi:hypothetical protein